MSRIPTSPLRASLSPPTPLVNSLNAKSYDGYMLKTICPEACSAATPTPIVGGCFNEDTFGPAPCSADLSL